MNKHQHIGNLKALKLLKYLRSGYIRPLIELGEQADLITFRILGKTFLLPISTAHIHHTFSKDQKQLIKTPKAQFYTKKAIGLGLISTDKKAWLEERRKVKEIFNKSELDQLIEITPTLVDEILSENNEIINAKELFSRISIATMGSIFFGGFSLASQMGIINAINELVKPTFRKISSPFSFFIDPLNRLTSNARNRIFTIIADNISKAQVCSKFNLTKKYFANDPAAVESITNIIVAGFETTANTLSWLIYELGQNENMFKQVSQEVKTANLYGGYSNLKEQIPFTEACLNETLRLYPPIWIMSRTTTEKMQLAETTIYSNTNLILSPLIIHRLNKYWGQPEKFDPSRFIRSNSIHDKSYFFPFGKGVRSCIGKNVAKLEIYVILIYMIKNYNMKIQSKIIKPLPYFTLVPDKPIHLQIKKL